MKNKHPESAEQIALVKWCRAKNIPIMAIPNGAKLSGANPTQRAIQGARLKAEGVMPGAADLLVLEMRGGYGGLFIEMKARGGRLSDHQKDFLALAATKGYKGVVCYSWLEAKDAIEAYLEVK